MGLKVKRGDVKLLYLIHDIAQRENSNRPSVYKKNVRFFKFTCELKLNMYINS